MSRRLTRIWLLPVLFCASQVWALGLGDIRLSSALNQPLRAEIELLSATPDELANLDIQLASTETFARYGLDRPLDLSRLRFDIVKSGRADGNLVRVTSADPVTEPFITFLVEAVWSRGRLLREYTLLLDPPTFAPPPVAQTTQPVSAPSRAATADSGQIQRPAPAAPQAEPAPQPPVTTPAPQSAVPVAAPRPGADDVSPAAPFDTTNGSEYQVQRGDTLWGIAARARADDRLSMSQMMMAIFEANPQAFTNNINLLSAGASLRIPSADEIFRISRGDALSEVQRQNSAWSGSAPVADASQPSLTLVPPDDEPAAYDGTVEEPMSTDFGLEDEPAAAVPPSDEQRIYEIEQLLLDHQDAIIEIEDNELAALREELANLKGEEYVEPEPVADDPFIDEAVTDGEIMVDDAADDSGVIDDAEDEIAADDSEAEPATPPTRVVTTAEAEDDGIVATILNALTGFWGILIGGIVVVLGVLVWFAMRPGRSSDDDATGLWNALDADDIDSESVASTERLRAMAQEDDTAIVVVEQESDEATMDDSMLQPTMEMPASPPPSAVPEGTPDVADATGINQALEDTFSSETAINLDQSDPIAEADFHMAYGLYDQAADLINGALAADPQRQDLLSKLCEVYFVWGNRDAFIDAAGRMQATVGDGESSADWDKIVIMGQQIAGDHELFSGVSAGAATKAVDLSFDGGLDDSGELDMDFTGGPDEEVSDIVDLGAESAETAALAPDDGLDFMFDEADTSASITREMPGSGADEIFEEATIEASNDSDTAESPTLDGLSGDGTVETPTIEQQFAGLDETGELASLTDADATEIASLDEEEPLPTADATAEIDLDDLGLDLDGLAESGLQEIGVDTALTDLDDTSESQVLDLHEDPDATGKNFQMDADALADTGKNPEFDADALVDVASATGMHGGLDVANMPDADATGQNPALIDDVSLTDTDTGIEMDTSLLDATGQTQILSADMAVATGADIGASISDEDQTLLAPGLDEDEIMLPDDAETLLEAADDDTSVGDFDFAKTEALPKEAFDGDSIDETSQSPALAGSTDLDLDLDDLTAALRVSEMGDTVDQPRDDATVEQPRIRPSGGVDMEIGGELDEDDDSATTARIAPEEMSGDLHDARTMTEVGTKLDLARAYVDMGDPGGARSILEEVLDEGDEGQRQQAQQLLDSLPG